ncbi:unnamed protein product [Cyprideis torosa]|uniref:Uncharacterized protein n=1 Tax=Cyprideis torosa TaxID=163714 RepID=A0A7R8WF12_9CRUS|nr:unnamed protein product [Cyprideis torosa]CAG0893559.1 unnamed protein product [Cyprideis torosa]
MTVSAIYKWILERFPFFKSKDGRWKNSVRHNLSINPQFQKGSKSRNGHLWTLAYDEPPHVAQNPLFADKSKRPRAWDCECRCRERPSVSETIEMEKRLEAEDCSVVKARREMEESAENILNDCVQQKVEVQPLNHHQPMLHGNSYHTLPHEFVPYIAREEVVPSQMSHHHMHHPTGIPMSTEVSTSHALAESLHIECDSVVDMLPEDLFFSPSQHFPILSPS